MYKQQNHHFMLAALCGLLIIPVAFTRPQMVSGRTILMPIAGVQPTSTAVATTATTFDNIIPMPVFTQSSSGLFSLMAASNVYIEPKTNETTAIGQYLVSKLNPATGYNLQVLETTGAPVSASNSASDSGNIYLTTLNGDPTLGDEGYTLTVTSKLVTLSAYKPAGLFRGIQTIRQLLPAGIEASTVQPGTWQIATGTIRDYPRFVWRGYMLDVARHFFGVDDVERILDLMAYYKMNYLHLHLSDDQGWRIAINSWPNLAIYGGSTDASGGSGGYYTQADYAAIVNYAQSRYITIVPEIDMPGHSRAALASYSQLNCDNNALSLDTGTLAGFSSLCVDKDITYTFITDVVRELAELTPGPYIHIGGDEPSSTYPADYVTFINRVQTIVKAYHKQVIGWQDISQGALVPDTLIQHWDWSHRDITLAGVQQGAHVIMSPISLGQRFAGFVTVQTGYDWEPTLQMNGLSEGDILGVEAPLWTEIVITRADLDRMTFPWLIGYAEIGWSPETGRNWLEYRKRLATHGSRLTALGVTFYRSPEISWK